MTNTVQAENSDNCKTSRRSALALAIELLAKHESITSTAELVKRTGYTARSIQLARSELNANHTSPDAKPASPDRETGFAGTDPAIARAHKESTPWVDDSSPKLFRATTVASSLRSQKAEPLRAEPRSSERDLRSLRPPGLSEEEAPPAATPGLVKKQRPRPGPIRLWTDPEPEQAWLSRDGTRLFLSPQERAFWEPRFGSSEQLDLALLRAVAYVQPNSGRSVLVQARAQLTRYAMEREEREQRYQRRKAEGQKTDSDNPSWDAYLAKRRAEKSAAAGGAQ